MRRKRSSRGRAPVTSSTIRSTAAASPATSSPRRGRRSAARGGSGPSRPSGPPRGSPARAARPRSCASTSVMSPGSLTCSESSVRPSTSTRVTLWISRTPGTAAAAACARSRRSLSSRRLDVDDDVASRQRPLDRRLDRVGGSVPLADRRGGETPITTSANCRPPPAASAAGAARPGAERRDRRARRRLGARRRAVHQHVDVAADQPRRGERARARRRRARRSSRRSGARRGRAGARRARRTSRRGRWRSGARSRRAPRSPFAATPATDRPRLASTTITTPIVTKTYQRGVHRRRRRPDQPLDRANADQHARGREKRRLGERGEVLGLAVPVLVGDVGRPAGDAEREEREQRGDEVGAGVDAPRRRARGCAAASPTVSLSTTQRCGGADRDERGPALRASSAPRAARRARPAPARTGGRLALERERRERRRLDLARRAAAARAGGGARPGRGGRRRPCRARSAR